MLKKISSPKITIVDSCAKARNFTDNHFDLCIINAPLPDESGKELSIELSKILTCQVIFVVKAEIFDIISAQVETHGIITIQKPVNTQIFELSLKITKAISARLNRLQSENCKLSQKIEDIKTIDRAKCILISYLGMSEAEAHKYIEKQAMDMRLSKRKICERILKTYES